MKGDTKLENLSEIAKDMNLIMEYFVDPSKFVDEAFALSSETARLTVMNKMMEGMQAMKKVFLEHAHDLDKQLVENNAILQKIIGQRDEFTKQLAHQRILVSQLSNQLVSVSEMLEKGKFSKKDIKEMLEQTKSYLVTCNKCKNRVHGTIDELFRLGGNCDKCNGELILHERILA